MSIRKWTFVLGFSLFLTFSFASQVSADDPIYLPLVSNPPPPPGVYLMTNHSYYRSGAYLYVVGEVWNLSGGPVGSQRVNADFYDSQGKLLATDYSYTHLDEAANGVKSCYSILLPEPAGWARYKLSGTYRQVSQDRIPALRVFNHSGSINSNGWYQVIGEVENIDSRRVTFVQPVVTLYDASNTVIDCDFTFVNSNSLNPGQVSAFEETLLSRDDYTDAHHYRIEISGNPQ